MNKKRVIFLFCITIISFFIYGLYFSDSKKSEDIKEVGLVRHIASSQKNKNNLSSNYQNPEQHKGSAVTTNAAAESVSENESLDELKKPEITEAFKKVLENNPKVKKYFQHLKYLGNSPQALSTRIWLAMGIFFSPGEDEARLMNNLLSDLKLNSDLIMGFIETNYVKIKTDDFFTEQMILPLVHNLTISPDRKAQFFGQVIDRPMDFVVETGHISARGANVTNALIYLRETRAPLSTIQTLLSRALETNRKDEKSYKELLMRINAYFPELQIK